MKKPNKSKRLRTPKQRKQRKSTYAVNRRMAVEQQRAQIDKQRSDEFYRRIRKDSKEVKPIVL